MCEAVIITCESPDSLALVVIPVHGNDIVPLGTLRSIIHQTGLSEDEFMNS